MANTPRKFALLGHFVGVHTMAGILARLGQILYLFGCLISISIAVLIYTDNSFHLDRSHLMVILVCAFVPWFVGRLILYILTARTITLGDIAWVLVLSVSAVIYSTLPSDNHLSQTQSAAQDDGPDDWISVDEARKRGVSIPKWAEGH